MKKIILCIILFLITLFSILGIYILNIEDTPITDTSDVNVNLILKENIINNSSWVDITKKDFNAYLNGTYTLTVQKIINSLEEAIPTIFYFSSKDTDEKNPFVVASAFDTSNNIYIYSYDFKTNQYSKKLYSLESLLKNSSAVYIYNKTEVTQWKRYTLLFYHL